MAKKYKLNINGGPVQNVNFNGTAWNGPLSANGVDVSYEDAPVVLPPAPPPLQDTVWKFSAAPRVPLGSHSFEVLTSTNPVRTELVPSGPVYARRRGTSENMGVPSIPIIEVSGSLVRAISWNFGGETPLLTLGHLGQTPSNPFVGRENQTPPYTNSPKSPSLWRGAWVPIVVENFR